MKRYKVGPFTLDIIDKIDSQYQLRAILPYATQIGWHFLFGVGSLNLSLNMYFHLLPFKGEHA
jgi:hypothetical protein